jgi:hypothetical protein
MRKLFWDVKVTDIKGSEDRDLHPHHHVTVELSSEGDCIIRDESGIEKNRFIPGEAPPQVIIGDWGILIGSVRLPHGEGEVMLQLWAPDEV